MFVEPQIGKSADRGWIEVVCGCMFSGKTEELLRRVRRAEIAKQKVELFKPEIDVRYDEVLIVSHNETGMNSTPVKSAQNILLLAGSAEVVGIDEAQFFDQSLVEVCTSLAAMGKRVIVAGLDMDYLGRPFGPMPELLAIADFVTKVHAICVKCGALATHSYRKNKELNQKVLLGEKDEYEPLCRFHFNQNMKK